jgi:plastocyanin
MSRLEDRVEESTTSTGTGALTLAGAATGARTVASLYADGEPVPYAIESADKSQWEVGVGSYSANGNVLNRTRVLASSSAGALVNLSAGTKRVWVNLSAQAALGGVTNAPFVAAIQFNGRRQLQVRPITGALLFTVNSVGAFDGATCEVDLIANGTNAPTFSGDFREWGGSMGYDNRAGIRNCLTFFRRSGIYYYSIAQAAGAVAETPAATALVLDGPAGSVISVASTNFTVRANGAITGTVTVTPSANGGGGTFTPATVAISSGTPSATFTYTAASTGAKTISVSGGGLEQPAVISHNVTATPVAPSAPTIGSATAGGISASVTFTAPADNGGAAIIDYTVTSSPGGITAVGATSPINVTGLTAGTAYTFTVTARNSVGSGAASAASNSVTPFAVDIVRVINRANLTESGDGVTGYNYVGTGTFFNTYGRADKTLPGSTNGWVQCVVGTVESPKTLCFGWTQGAAPTTGSYSTCRFGVYVNPTTYGRLDGTSLIAVARTPIVGDIVRLEVSGTNILIRVSSNGGTSFDTIHTYDLSGSPAFVSAIKGVAFSNDNGGSGPGSFMNNIRHSGLV